MQYIYRSCIVTKTRKTYTKHTQDLQNNTITLYRN